MAGCMCVACFPRLGFPTRASAWCTAIGCTTKNEEESVLLDLPEDIWHLIFGHLRNLCKRGEWKEQRRMLFLTTKQHLSHNSPRCVYCFRRYYGLAVCWRCEAEIDADGELEMVYSNWWQEQHKLETRLDKKKHQRNKAHPRSGARALLSK